MIVRLTITVALITLSSIAIAQEQTAQTTQTPVAEVPVSPVADATVDANIDATTGTEPASSEATPAVDAAVDEDAEAKAAKLKELLSLVQDNTLNVHLRENPAYFMLLKDVLERTPEQLRNEVTANPRFNDLYKNPNAYRGQLVHVRLNARRILPVAISSNNSAGVTRLYEIWGWTDEAKAWMYCCVVPELPEGFEEGDISKRIELTGYFFKMQAYQPGGAEPNARNLVAPLVIGRIVDAGPAQATTDSSIGNWPLILIIGFGIIVMFRILLHTRRIGGKAPMYRNYRRRSLEPVDTSAIEDALEGPERGIRIRNADE